MGDNEFGPDLTTAAEPAELEPVVDVAESIEAAVEIAEADQAGSAEFGVADEEDPTPSAAPAPPLPALAPHLEQSLSLLLGGDDRLNEYRSADSTQRLEILKEALLPSEDEESEDDIDIFVPQVDLERARTILDQITERTQAQMTQAGFFENRTDGLARINALASHWRRLGTDKMRGLVGVGLGLGSVVLTSAALRSAEVAVGTGGIGGAALGSLGYQGIYQRTIENRWQRGQSIWKTARDRLTRPLSFASNNIEERDKLAAEQKYGRIDDAKTMFGRGWRRAQHWMATHADAYQRRAYQEEKRVHLQPEQVESLSKPQLLQRLAEGRLALTRHDRRSEKWQDKEPNKQAYQVKTYAALVKVATQRCTPAEIEAACRRVERMTGVHLVGSVLFGVAGAAAGYFGAHKWHEAHPHQVEQTISDDDRIIVASDQSLAKAKLSAVAPSTSPTSPTPAPAVPATPAVPVPTASSSDLAQHLQRANLLEHYGAGHYDQSGFHITAQHEIDAQGNGWIEVNNHRLEVKSDVTNVQPLVADRVAELQQVKGVDLANIYAPGADQAVVDQAIHLKDALAQHLVEQQIYGQSTLDPQVHTALAGVGYDFNLADTGDARQEIHQAMAKWLGQHQVAATPLPKPAPALPTVEHTGWDSHHATPRHHRPIIARSAVRHEPVEVISKPVVRPTAHLTAQPTESTIEVVSSTEYTGWHLPTDQTPKMSAPTQVETLSPARVSAPVLSSHNGVAPTDIQTPKMEPLDQPMAAPKMPVSAPRVPREAVLDDYFKGKPIKSEDIQRISSLTD